MWGGIFPPRYDLSNEEMEFPDICLACAVDKEEAKQWMKNIIRDGELNVKRRIEKNKGNPKRIKRSIENRIRSGAGKHNPGDRKSQPA